MSENFKLLLIDDDEAHRQALSLDFKQACYETIFIDSTDFVQSLEAEELWREQYIILVSINTPIDVKAFLSYFKTQFRLRNIPLIVVATPDKVDEAAQWLELGFDDYLLEPIYPVLLKSTLSNAHEKANLKQEIGLFVYYVASEIHNPLASIKGYAEVMLKNLAGPISEQQSNFLKVIRRNAIRTHDLVVDLSIGEAIKVNSLSRKFSPVEVSEIINDALTMFREKPLEKQHTLTLEVPETLPLVQADKQRITDAAYRIIDNAHRYTADGGQITITAIEKLYNPQLEIEISVKDNGCGIAPDDQKQLFKQFWRSSDPKIQEQSGFGMSLFIAKGIIEHHGGRIWFESQPNEGSTFHFTLPIASTP